MKAGPRLAVGLLALSGGFPAVLGGFGARADAGAPVEPLPTIVTYELAKARREAHAVERDPKAFWVGAIVARIEDRKPLVDLLLKQPATVEVAFAVGRDGRIVSRQVARSSGNAALDARALAVLDKAAPFPPMPAALADDTMSFSLPLRFK